MADCPVRRLIMYVWRLKLSSLAGGDACPHSIIKAHWLYHVIVKHLNEHCIIWEAHQRQEQHVRQPTPWVSLDTCVLRESALQR